MDQQYAAQLKATLAGTLQAEKQKDAEAYLKKLANEHPNRGQFVPALLRIVCDASADLGVRQSAAIKFKNCITKGWEYHDDHPEIDESLKPTLRAQMIDIMCSVPSILQAQISESVRIMAVTDFPKLWPDLLPRMVAKMNGSTNPETIIGVLKAAHEIFKQFRNMSNKHENLVRLKAALDAFADPLTKFYTKVGKMAMGAMQNKANLSILYEALTLMTEIFYSLNWYTIPEYFEDNMATWMPAFRTFLSPTTDWGKVFAEPHNKDVETPREKLRTAIVSCVSVYAEKYDEEFRPYFPTFLKEVVTLLMGTPQDARYDSLVINGLSFLSQAVLKAANIETFGASGFLRNLVEKVIYKNLTMHQVDAEEFEDNPEEFIRRDIEGSDRFTRRKSACDLLRNMRRNFDAQISDLALTVIQTLLRKYAANPAAPQAWMAKETAVQMYLAVGISGFTVRNGVSEENINPHMKAKADVKMFFKSQVLADLQNPAANPILKASALKFTSIFRQQLASANLLPVLLPALVSPSVVVHTYAANCLERSLVIRDAGGPRIASASLAPHAMPLLKNLFAVVENAEFSDNEYTMKAVMRVILVADTHIAANGGWVQTLCKSLCTALSKIIKKSTSPVYNHYVFDSLAALVRVCCGKNKAMVPIFMKVLLPAFQPILADGESDFYPYALQMLAQLLSFATPGAPLPPLFLKLLDQLMTDEMWANRGLIPATVQLLQIYFRVAPAHLVSGQYHVQILKRFQKLLKKRATEEYALQLVQTLLACLPIESLKQFLPQIMNMIGARLLDRKKQGPYYMAHVTGFLGFFTGKFSTRALKEAWKVPGAPLPMVIKDVWAKYANRVSGIGRRKATAVATVMLVMDPDVHSNAELFLGLLKALLDMLEVSVMNLDDDAASGALDAEEIQFSSSGAFRKLSAAKLNDSVKTFYQQIPNTRQYFRTNLHKLLHEKPNLKAVCQQVDKKDHKVALKQLFAVSAAPAAAAAAGGGGDIFGTGAAASGGVFGAPAPAPAASGSDPFGGGGGGVFGGSSGAGGDPFGGGGGGGGAFGF